MRLEPQIGLRKLPGLNAFILHSEEVEVLWELLEPFVASSVRHSFGTVTVEGIRKMLFEKQVTAGVLLENDKFVSVFVFHVVPYETYKSVRIIAAAGKRMEEAFKRVDVLITWALSHGASEIEGWCRPSMVRFLRRYGFKPRLSMVTLDIKRSMQ